MRRQPDHVVAGLGLHLEAERLLLGVGGAGQAEVLPHHHAQLVTGLVEAGLLVDAAAPDPQEVDVGVLGLLHPLAVPLVGDPAREAVVRDPVHAADEHQFAVDPQAEGLARAVGVRCGVERDAAEAGLALHLVEDGDVVVEHDVDGVERLVAEAVRPPRLDVADRDDDLCPVLGRRARLCVGLRGAFSVDPHGEGSEPGASRHLHVHAELAVPAAGAVRCGGGEHGDVGDAGGVPAPQSDGLPDAGRDEPWPPVPAEVAGHLAHKVVGVALDVDPLADESRHERGVLQHGCEGDLNDVRPGLEEVPDAEDVAAVHVHGAADQRAVAEDFGDGVEAVAQELAVVGLQFLGVSGQLEFSTVGPGLLAHPVLVGLRVTEVRVIDQALCQQVGVHNTGHGGGDTRGKLVTQGFGHGGPALRGRVRADAPRGLCQIQPTLPHESSLTPTTPVQPGVGCCLEDPPLTQRCSQLQAS